METKHTPGPWFGRKDGKYSMECPWSIDHEDGHNASWLPVTTEKRRTLALVVNDDTKRPMDFHDAEMHANAKLIASAPDLLADLVVAAETLRRYEALHRTKCTAESLEKAEVNAGLAHRFEQTIAKATA
ncbi:hypothetical protein [Pseudomonas extremaustralis]|uniref:hypothetical protein n=1 Tax=Pseudomonas extremaustralis TaxID=359110 RepID=UPI002AA88ADB|nr:hypothetical protein [Pseudomonas extremaustralis]